MNVLTQMDQCREISVAFREARDHMVAVYDKFGVESVEFDKAYDMYVCALADYEHMMDEYESIRASISNL